MWASTVWGFAGFSFGCVVGMLTVSDPALRHGFGVAAALFAVCCMGAMLWPSVRRLMHAGAHHIRPDISITSTLDYIVNDSRTPLKQSPPPEIAEHGPAKGRVVQQRGVEHQDALTKIHEKLISGELIGWGHRQYWPPTFLPSFEPSIRQIPREYWDIAFLHPLYCFGGDSGVQHTAFANFQPQPAPYYTALQFNRSQVMRLWRRRSLPSRIWQRLCGTPRITYWRPFSSTQ